MAKADESFPQHLDQQLQVSGNRQGAPVALDLFAGCGGLALGFEAAGFLTIGFERDEDCCNTYRLNLSAPCHAMRLKPGKELTDGAAVIVGGPPCQPFSVNGHQNGKKDERDGFPAYLWAVERYQPQVALFENVRGPSQFVRGFRFAALTVFPLIDAPSTTRDHFRT